GSGAVRGAVRILGVAKQTRLCELDELLVLEVSRRSDDDLRRAVARIVIGGDVLRRKGRDHLPAPDYRPAKRMVREDGRREDIVHLVLWLVLVHRYLLEHDVAL